MRRGDLWWAHLPSPSGSEPGYRRPVVIIQSDVFNESGIRTVVVLSVTSNLRLAEAPGNVLLKKQLSGLSRDSVINVSQIATIDKSRITDYVATLPDGVLERAERGLRLVLAL
ncbi:MAG: type II toxin-antitoxin system PemK/MazF family toxin [Chloroflexi bacterium]|nr:type II toxin-antitoxin system PemK/MazF family toxin [Chloroflexota bacterium]